LARLARLSQAQEPAHAQELAPTVQVQEQVQLQTRGQGQPQA
jgi:hypothetical protein